MSSKKIQNSSISGATLKDGARGWRIEPDGTERELSKGEVAQFIKEADELFGDNLPKKTKKDKGKRALANAFSKELIAQKFSGKPDPDKLAGIVAQIRDLPGGKPTQAEFDLVKTTMVDSGITLDDALDTLADSLQVGFDKAMDAIRDDPPIHASDMSKVYQEVDEKIDQALTAAAERFQDTGLVCLEEVEEVVDDKVKPLADAISDLRGRLDGVNLNLRRLDGALMEVREDLEGGEDGEGHSTSYNASLGANEAAVFNLSKHVEQNGQYLDAFVDRTTNHLQSIEVDLTSDRLAVTQLKHDVGLVRSMATRAVDDSKKVGELFHQVDSEFSRFATTVNQLEGGFKAQLKRTNELDDRTRLTSINVDRFNGDVGELRKQVSALGVDVHDVQQYAVTGYEELSERLEKLERAGKPVADGLKTKDPWNTPRPGAGFDPRVHNLESEREDARDAESALEVAFEIKRLHQEIESYSRMRQDIVDNDEQFASLNSKRLVEAADQKIADFKQEIEDLRGEFESMVGGDVDIDSEGLYPADEDQFGVDMRAGPNGSRALFRNEQRDILVNKLMGHAVYWSVHPKMDEETEAEHRYRITSGTVVSILGELDGNGEMGSGYLVIPNSTRSAQNNAIMANENYSAFVPAIHEHHQLNQLDVAGELKGRAEEMTRAFRSTFRRKLTNKA